MDDAGFPLELRRKASRELEWLYPPEVCAGIVEKNRPAVFADLFYEVGWRIAPLLEVGLDIAEVGRFDFDRKMIADLRGVETFASAAAELSVWANLKRAGFNVHRAVATQAKTPDFWVFANFWRHPIEVKHLRASDYELARERLSLELLSLVVHRSFPERVCVLRQGPEFRSVDPTTLHLRRAELIEQCESAVERAQAAHGDVGTYEGGPLVSLEIRADPAFRNGTALDELLPLETSERRAERALRLLRDAAQQLWSKSGIVVLDVGSLVTAREVARLLHGKGQRPVAFSSCETVIVREIRTNRFREPELIATPITVHGEPVLLHEQIAGAISFRRFRNPTLGRGGSRHILPPH